MRTNSLALRLFLTATAWIAAILIVTGFVLSSLYQQTMERAFDQRLNIYLKTLIADIAAPEEANDRLPESLGEPLFELPLSGWYWQITRIDTEKPDIRASRSLWDGVLPRLEDARVDAQAGGARQGYGQGPDEQRVRILERSIDLGADGRYLVSVAGDASEVDEETRDFNWALVTTFGILALVLVFTTVFQVTFGLAPLKRISESLAAIRSGKAERLEGSFPEEIAPLARETNALLEANREIVERARTHVGNLAHALKTPLSVIMNEATARGGDVFAAKVREQADIMRDQVARHLERARLATRSTVFGAVTDVRPVVSALARTMQKLHSGRDIAVQIEAPEEGRFRGEPQDLEEMVGNLVDNAFKWAQSRVRIAVTVERRQGNSEAHRVHIIVEDDGSGLSPAEREQVVARRGSRFDESKPGSGLGLSIVLELAALYGGYLKLGTASLGGLQAELVLPAA
jgi:signal transduction histidine kinase